MTVAVEMLRGFSVVLLHNAVSDGRVTQRGRQTGHRRTASEGCVCGRERRAELGCALGEDRGGGTGGGRVW